MQTKEHDAHQIACQDASCIKRCQNHVSGPPRSRNIFHPQTGCINVAPSHTRAGGWQRGNHCIERLACREARPRIARCQVEVGSSRVAERGAVLRQRQHSIVVLRQLHMRCHARAHLHMHHSR